MGRSKENVFPLGNYITLCKRRNKNLESNRLIGVTVDKKIIYKGLLSKQGLENCWVVEKGDFVTCLMQISRDKKLPIDLYSEEHLSIASGSYYVFRVTKPELSSEYLMIYLKSSKIDKLAVFWADRGIRGTLSWENFTRLPISIPPLEVQQRIVNKYETLKRIIQLKREINEKLERWMQSLFHVLFDNLEEDQFIYKDFGELFSIIGGGRPPKHNEALEAKYFCKEGGTPWLQVKDLTKTGSKFVHETSEQLTKEGVERCRARLIPSNSLLMIAIGVGKCSIAKLGINLAEMYISGHFWYLNFTLGKYLCYSYFFIKDFWRQFSELLVNNSTGTIGLNAKKMCSIITKIPKDYSLISKFDQICRTIFEAQKANEKVIAKCLRLQKCISESLD